MYACVCSPAFELIKPKEVLGGNGAGGQSYIMAEFDPLVLEGSKCQYQELLIGMLKLWSHFFSSHTHQLLGADDSGSHGSFEGNGQYSPSNIRHSCPHSYLLGLMHDISAKLFTSYVSQCNHVNAGWILSFSSLVNQPNLLYGTA